MSIWVISKHHLHLLSPRHDEAQLPNLQRTAHSSSLPLETNWKHPYFVTCMRSQDSSLSSTLRITDWFGWEETFQGHPVPPPAMGRDIFKEIRVLRALSNLAWNVSRDGASPTTLGNLGQGLTTLNVKNFFLRSSRNLPSFSLKPSPLVLSLHALVKSPSPALSQAPSCFERPQ